jgi:hypothetical protein
MSRLNAPEKNQDLTNPFVYSAWVFKVISWHVLPLLYSNTQKTRTIVGPSYVTVTVYTLIEEKSILIQALNF